MLTLGFWRRYRNSRLSDFQTSDFACRVLASVCINFLVEGGRSEEPSKLGTIPVGLADLKFGKPPIRTARFEARSDPECWTYKATVSTSQVVGRFRLAFQCVIVLLE